MGMNLLPCAVLSLKCRKNLAKIEDTARPKGRQFILRKSRARARTKLAQRDKRRDSLLVCLTGLLRRLFHLLKLFEEVRVRLRFQDQVAIAKLPQPQQNERKNG